LDCDGTVFACGVRALFGSLFIFGRFPVSLKIASVPLVGEGGVRRAGVIGCGETGYEGW